MELKRNILLVAALLTNLAGHAAEPVVDDGEALVNAFVNDVVTFSADFEQSLIDPDGRMLEKTSGTLEIQRPGRFRWVYEEPYEQWLVADGANIWSYDVDLEQVTVKPQAEALANTPALLLGLTFLIGCGAAAFAPAGGWQVLRHGRAGRVHYTLVTYGD